MATKDGMGPEEIEAAEAEQDEAEYYRQENDPSCQICGVKESNHWLSDQLHQFKEGVGDGKS